jgi:hypothetical protein
MRRILLHEVSYGLILKSPVGIICTTCSNNQELDTVYSYVLDDSKYKQHQPVDFIMVKRVFCLRRTEFLNVI